MRSANHACVLGLVLALAASCGDNTRPDLVVETRVAKRTVAAGERIGARCAVRDEFGNPALDEHGQPLTDNVDLAVTYRHEDSFSTDGDGQIIAVRAGTATVRCSAPTLGLVDPEPEEIEIVAGPPSRVITQLAGGTAVAGERISPRSGSAPSRRDWRTRSSCSSRGRTRASPQASSSSAPISRSRRRGPD